MRMIGSRRGFGTVLSVLPVWEYNYAAKCSGMEWNGTERFYVYVYTTYNVPSRKRLPICLNIHREAFSKLWIRWISVGFWWASHSSWNSVKFKYYVNFYTYIFFKPLIQILIASRFSLWINNVANWILLHFTFFFSHPSHTRNSCSIVSISLMNLWTMLSCCVMTRHFLVLRFSMLLISSMAISVDRSVGIHLSMRFFASRSIVCNLLLNNFNDASQFSKFPGRKMS